MYLVLQKVGNRHTFHDIKCDSIVIDPFRVRGLVSIAVTV